MRETDRPFHILLLVVTYHYHNYVNVASADLKKEASEVADESLSSDRYGRIYVNFV